MGGSWVRVFAPAATSVRVYGRWNSYDLATAVPLDPAGEYWEGFVTGLATGDQYELLVGRGEGGENHRLDPAARDTDNSSLNNRDNHSLVVNPTFTWSPFTTPGFDDLILYQCHVGSFCGCHDDHPDQGVATFDQLQTKLDYIRGLGFNALALLPVQEFRFDRSWGYNPSFYFALESAYGRPDQLCALVDACHRRGLAVIFDVVYNHISDDDSSFWHFDENADGGGGSYLYDPPHVTQWGQAPAFWRQGIRDFFLANVAMLLGEYNGDGLRFDSTRTIEDTRGWADDGWAFMQYLTWLTKQRFPGKYLVAEHLPDHDTILSSAGFHATWVNEPFFRMLGALDSHDPVANIEGAIGSAFGEHRTYFYSWNTVTYLMGSHDDCGDANQGANGHRRFVARFGGRDNWYARAKARVAWSLNVAMKGTPMMFMGSECHLDGYWHDGPDGNGDHRFDWDLAGDPTGMPMRHLVEAANQTRWSHPALRGSGLEVTHRDPHGVIAFKRWNDVGDVVLVVVNADDRNYTDTGYGVATGQNGRWRQILCSQDSWFGGWDGAGNAFYEPWTQSDGRIYVNVPQWSVTMFCLL